jgi:transposase
MFKGLIYKKKSSKELKHYGIISALIDKLKIVEKIDERLPMERNRLNGVTRGQIVKALIINTLAFAERRLYLVADFFNGLNPEKLIGPGVTAEKLNDDIIGRTLDEIFKYGVRKLLTEIAIEIIGEHSSIQNILHIDTTSISVEGNYNDPSTDLNGVEFTIRHGYSKDRRPDLKQFIYSLITIGKSNIPLSAEVLPGNSSDKKVMIELIGYVKQFYEELYKQNCPYIFVADSALYNKDNLLTKKYSLQWITRIPETISKSKELKVGEYDNWEEYDDNYSMLPFSSEYGGVQQRWILVQSKDAYERDIKLLQKNLEKKEAECNKAIIKLSKEIFHCKKDALKAVTKLEKKYPLFFLRVTEMVSVYHNDKVGRPGKGTKKLSGHSVRIEMSKNEEAIKKLEIACGRFILGSNIIDETFTDRDIFKAYKDQAKVENCFRFMKNPSFFASDIYLKKTGRIEALMFVITLAIMIYNIGQYYIRKQLGKYNTLFPNQVGKMIGNPTLRWIFQSFRLIQISSTGEITNMKMHLAIIVSFFGKKTMDIYGIRGDPPPFVLSLN